MGLRRTGDVSIVIRTKNEGRFIEKTLRAIEDQDFSGDYEVIIVDSGSTDGTLGVVRNYGVRVIQISEEEFSYGRALNIGATNAAGAYIVSLSAHALPRDATWLTNLISEFCQPDVAATYGRQVSFDAVNPFEALLNKLCFGSSKIKFNSGIDNRLLKRIHFTNSNCAVKKKVWQRIKFNERVQWGEDLVWQARVIKAGFSIVYSPGAVVYHTHKVNIRSVYRNSVNWTYNWSVIQEKRRRIPLILSDAGLFLGMAPHLLVRNVVYAWRSGHYRHIKVAPFWVLSGLLGSFVGRALYRAGKRLW
jgi:rhamnosyltransferase